MSDSDTYEVKLDPNWTGSGVAMTLRWERLEEMLKEQGQLRTDEKLDGAKVTQHGIRYYIGNE